MVLYMIGIGLFNENDISVRGLSLVKGADVVYLEGYTSKLGCTIKDLENLYGQEIILADRELVEKQAEATILKDAVDKKVAFLVIGDVFSATTHVDLMQRAKNRGIEVHIVHNASIISAIGVTGLEVYKFGKVVSIPFDNSQLKSPVENFKKNFDNELHTLFLLDVQSDKDKYMTFAEGADYLISNGVDESLIAIGCAQLGADEPVIVVDTLGSLRNNKINQFPQSLIIPAKKLHFMEEDILASWKK